MGSNPSCRMMGYRIGTVMKMMDTVSRMQPRNSSRQLIIMKNIHRLNCISVTIRVRAWGTCSMVSTKPNRVAPIMMAKIMEDVFTVPSRMLGRSLKDRVL